VVVVLVVVVEEVLVIVVFVVVVVPMVVVGKPMSFKWLKGFRGFLPVLARSGFFSGQSWQIFPERL
jgi:hypothetical protein